MVNINTLKQYHGSDGVDKALSTHISLRPETVVQLLLHCLVIRGLVHDYSVQGHHLPLFVQRCALISAMVLNWYRDQKEHIFGGEEDGIIPQSLETQYPTSERAPETKVQLKDWANRMCPEDPFTLLIRDGSSREKLHAMLDADDSISSICGSLKGSICANVTSSSWMRSLEILENNEIGLAC